MPDIEELLSRGAPGRSAPPDTAAIGRRAYALRRRRTAARSAAGGLLAAALVLGSLQTGSSRTEGSVLVPAVTGPSASASSAARATAAATTPAPVAARGGRPAAQPPVPTAAAPSAPSLAPRVPAPPTAPAARAVRSAPAPAATPALPPRPSQAAGHPRASGCSVSTDGALPGEQRTCRFTATAAGGHAARQRGGAGTAYPSWTVQVVRDGRRTTYGGNEPGCRNATVRPGDLVTVTVTTADAVGGVTLLDVSAGRGSGC